MTKLQALGLKAIKVENLVAGNMIDVWYLTYGAASTVKTVEIKERPGYKYNAVKVTMEDGQVFTDETGRCPLTGIKVGVYVKTLTSEQRKLR